MSAPFANSGLDDPTAFPIDEAKVVAHDKNCVVGIWNNVLLNVYRHTEARHIDLLRPIIRELQEAHPVGIGMLTIVEQNAPMPSNEVREKLPALFKSVAPGVLCSTLIFEGSGFKAAAVRAITTTFNRLANQPFPHKVFATVDDAASWMSPKLRPGARGDVSALKLRSACSRIRERLEAS